jgi:hypothetical protein
MDGYRIRRGAGTETAVVDAAALVALARAGRVRPSDEIATAAGWVRADALPELRGLLRDGDPWAAWSDVDSIDAVSVYRQMVDPDPEDLPSDALSPVGDAAGGEPVADAPTAPPGARIGADRPAPPVVGPGPAGGPRREAPLPRFDPAVADALAHGAEVIDFPRPRPAAAPNTPSAHTLPPRARPAAPPLVRGSRVLAMVAVGLLLLLLGYSWIKVGGSKLGVSAPRTAGTPATPTGTAPAVAAPLVALEKDLRASLPGTARAVAKAGDLSDALLVELVQLRVDVVSADGVVTKWAGRRLDEPKSAEVRIQYRSSGDISREIAAMALVVGRYKRLYRLDIPVFEVTDTTGRGMTRIDAAKAEAFYQARLTLEQLLTSVAAQPPSGLPR